VDTRDEDAVQADDARMEPGQYERWLITIRPRLAAA
jgi:hypothetical protein